MVQGVVSSRTKNEEKFKFPTLSSITSTAIVDPVAL